MGKRCINGPDKVRASLERGGVSNRKEETTNFLFQTKGEITGLKARNTRKIEKKYKRRAFIAPKGGGGVILAAPWKREARPAGLSKGDGL